MVHSTVWAKGAGRPCPTGETCIARRCQVPEGCGDKLCAPGREDCGTCPGDCPCPEGQTCFANRCQLIGFFASAGGPYRGVVDQLITFEAAVTTNPGETVTDYLWDFGDGSVESGRAPSHAYGKEGSFLVRLTVKTDKGLTSQAMTTATVLPSLAARDFSTDAYFSYDADIEATRRLVPGALDLEAWLRRKRAASRELDGNLAA